MRWKSIALGAVALGGLAGIALLPARKSAATVGETRGPETQKDKLSYAMGVAMAKSFARQSVELDTELVARGLRDGLAGGKLLISDEDLRNAIATFQGELKQKQVAAQTAAEESKKRGDVFLAENAKSEGVVTLPSGLQYKVLKAGDGNKATDGDVVQCHYRSMLIDGTEFDNSYKRGQPARFPIARALPAWKQALKLMPVGSKWTLYVPPALAFGQRGLRPKMGRAPAVGPNTAVVFDLELLAINPGKSGGAQTAAGTAPAPVRED